jgi:hypothetical protein
MLLWKRVRKSIFISSVSKEKAAMELQFQRRQEF